MASHHEARSPKVGSARRVPHRFRAVCPTSNPVICLPKRESDARPEVKVYYEDEKAALPFVYGILIGAVVGAAIALLAAPASGKRTRRKMLRQVLTAQRAAGERVDDWADELRSALKPRRRHLRL